MRAMMMLMLMLLLAVIVVLPLPGGAAPAAGVLPRRVNEFKLQNAAVASIATSGFPGSDGPALLLTTFGPIGKDQVLAVPNIGGLLHNGSTPTPLPLDANAKWPNMATFVPAGTLSVSPTASVLEAGGFFVSPTKSTGEVALLDLQQLPGVPRKKKISTDKQGWFYHEAAWLDVNGDGRLDSVAARAKKPVLGASHSELVAFLQPPVPGPTPWQELVLTAGGTGPGVGFALVDLDDNNKTQVVASQFFAAQHLSIWWCDAPQWSGCGNPVAGEALSPSAQNVVIDTDPDKAGFFAVSWIDLDGDGRKDLLATTNEANGRGGVYAYEQPHGDWRTEKWVKHTLATGYKPTMPFLPGRGSPGAAQAFFVQQPFPEGARPWILVSGDDGGFVDLLTPTGAKGSWAYQKQRVVNSTGTIGTLAVGDLNGDGVADFAVPLYAENKVALFSFILDNHRTIVL